MLYSAENLQTFKTFESTQKSIFSLSVPCLAIKNVLNQFIFSEISCKQVADFFLASWRMQTFFAVYHFHVANFFITFIFSPVYSVSQGALFVFHNICI